MDARLTQSDRVWENEKRDKHGLTGTRRFGLAVLI